MAIRVRVYNILCVRYFANFGNATNPMSAIRSRVGHLSRNCCTARRNTSFYSWISLSWHCSTNDSSFRANRTLFLRIIETTNKYVYVHIYMHIYFFFYAIINRCCVYTNLDRRTRESIRVPSRLLYRRSSNCWDFPYRRTGSEVYQQGKPSDSS